MGPLKLTFPVGNFAVTVTVFIYTPDSPAWMGLAFWGSPIQWAFVVVVG